MQLESVKTLCPDPSVLGIPVFNHGWNSGKAEFSEIVLECQHSVIVEVGSWFGQSAMKLAELQPNAVIICVDSFLGSTDHMPFRLPRNMGFPDIYRQFLMNTASSPFSDRIFPLIQTSRNAAKMLRSLPYKPTLCYVDASHEEADAYDDAVMYNGLLGEGGVLFGDDFGNPDHPGVEKGIRRFAQDFGLRLEVKSGFWRAKKA